LTLVSIIIPAYHAGEFLERCLDSIAAQTVTDYEIIIAICDPDYDDSLEIINSHMLFPKINVYVRPDNTNIAFARNKGIELSMGEYIALIDADDEWLPNHLKNVVKHLSERPRTMYLAYCKVTYLEFNKSKLYPCTSTMAIRKSDILVPFREDIAGGEDGQWQTDLIENGIKLDVVKNVDAIYYKYPGQTSRKTLIFTIKRHAQTRQYKQLCLALLYVILKPITDYRFRHFDSPCDHCLKAWGCKNQLFAGILGCKND